MTSGRPTDEPDPASEGADTGHEWHLGEADDPRVQAGLDHLQRAAREVIAASRALLDVAEDLVDDPKAAGGLLGLLAQVGDLAARAARPGGRRDPWPDDDDEGDDGPPVQRIPVS